MKRLSIAIQGGNKNETYKLHNMDTVRNMNLSVQSINITIINNHKLLLPLLDSSAFRHALRHKEKYSDGGKFTTLLSVRKFFAIS